MKDLTWLQIVLTALAVYRLTILVTRDTITDGPRHWLQRQFTGTFVDFWECPWCTSVWIAAGACALTYYEWDWWQWVCLGLTSSAVAGFFSEHS